ncbi:hypothetical protein RFI_09569, partial [Reticulomyxa filosa]
KKKKKGCFLIGRTLILQCLFSSLPPCFFSCLLENLLVITELNQLQELLVEFDYLMKDDSHIILLTATSEVKISHNHIKLPNRADIPCSEQLEQVRSQLRKHLHHHRKTFSHSVSLKEPQGRLSLVGSKSHRFSGPKGGIERVHEPSKYRQSPPNPPLPCDPPSPDNVAALVPQNGSGGGSALDLSMQLESGMQVSPLLRSTHPSWQFIVPVFLALYEKYLDNNGAPLMINISGRLRLNMISHYASCRTFQEKNASASSEKYASASFQAENTNQAQEQNTKKPKTLRSKCLLY